MMYRYFANGNYGRGFGGGNGGYGNFNCLNNFGYGYFGGWGILIMIGVLILTALLIFFIVHNKNKKLQNQSAMETLKMKYVQGEITEEEFLRRKSLLERE
jgi:putative membrane protein